MLRSPLFYLLWLIYFIGAGAGLMVIGSVSGMNARGISLGEMGGRGEGQWDGVPMATLMRRAMEECTTLDEVTDLWTRSPRTCEYYYVFADGKTRRSVGVAATPERIELVWPGEGHELLGAGIPVLMNLGLSGSGVAVFALLVAGAALTLACVALSTWIALRSDDRLKGIGMTLAAWLLTSLLYDGAVVAFAAAFGDWPIEKPMLAMMLANPVDLARVLVLANRSNDAIEEAPGFTVAAARCAAARPGTTRRPRCAGPAS